MAAALLTSEMDSYMEGSIAHMVGLSCNEDQLRKKLQQAERSQLDSQLQVYYLQARLSEMQQKCDKAKEEACLSAQALKKQIAETQKMAESCKELREECTRLENECMLYHNDREVFMEAADEAEERAVAAENRSAEVGIAWQRYEEALEELRELRLACLDEQSRHKNEMLVQRMVSTSIRAAALRAVEQEREEAIESSRLSFCSDLRQVEAKLHIERERLKASETYIQTLYSEAEEFRRDAQQYEANLKKAEVEVEYLYHENNELKLLLGGKHPGSDGQAISPLHIQGIKCQSTTKPRQDKMEPLLRQPLTPLRSNLSDWRRQYR